MNITLEKTGDLVGEIRLHLDPADYKKAVMKKLKEQARQANIPGFRAGKVPVGIIRKMVGKSVVIEEVNHIVGHALYDYIKEEDLDVLGDPLPAAKLKEEDFDEYCEKEMDFVFEVGLAPAFELNLEGVEAPVRYEVAVDDAFMDAEIEKMQDTFAAVQTPDDVQEGDTVYGRLEAIDADGNVIEDGFSQMVALNPDRMGDADFFKPFIGAEKESVHSIDVWSLADSPKEVGELLFIQEDELEKAQANTLQFVVKRINRIEKMPLGPDFYAKVVENKRWEVEEAITEEKDFRDRMADEIEQELKQGANSQFRVDLQKNLLAAHPMDFPDAFLKKWLVETREDYNEARVEAEYGDYTKSLVWTLILQKIFDANPGMRIEQSDIESEVRQVFDKAPELQEGETEEEAAARQTEYLDGLVKYVMQNEEMTNMYARKIQDDRVYTHLEEQITIVEDSMTATAFQELQEQQRKEAEAEAKAREEAAIAASETPAAEAAAE